VAKLVSDVAVMFTWNRAHVERRIHDHFAMSCERNMVMRAWDIRCSCGRRGLVYDSVGDDGLFVSDSELHAVAENTTLCTVCGDICNPAVSYDVCDTCVEMGVRDERDRLRAAMSGMANVMACVVRAIDGREACLLMVSAQGRGDMELPTLVQIGKVVVTRAHVKAVASAEWSRRVRERVAKLKPTGPIVACQGDWEDD
jgi:hypothetical protein